MHAGCKSYISYNFNFKDAKKEEKKKICHKANNHVGIYL